jgi:hypothetical protein
MKLIYKILWVNVGIALVIAFLIPLDGLNSVSSYFFGLGAISLVGAIVDLIVSFILFMIKKKEWAQGYLLTAGVLLLLGAVTCTMSA